MSASHDRRGNDAMDVNYVAEKMSDLKQYLRFLIFNFLVDVDQKIRRGEVQPEMGIVCTRLLQRLGRVRDALTRAAEKHQLFWHIKLCFTEFCLEASHRFRSYRTMPSSLFLVVLKEFHWDRLSDESDRSVDLDQCLTCLTNDATMPYSNGQPIAQVDLISARDIFLQLSNDLDNPDVAAIPELSEVTRVLRNLAWSVFEAIIAIIQ